MLKNKQRQASGSDGNKIRNEILLNLSRQECEFHLSKLEFVRLRPQQILTEGGEALKSAYFCNSGMFSILNVMPNGKSVEVGLIGKEGVFGSAADRWISYQPYPNCSSRRSHSIQGGCHSPSRSVERVPHAEPPTTAVFTDIGSAGNADRNLQSAP
jgi:hypothetical protein